MNTENSSDTQDAKTLYGSWIENGEPNYDSIKDTVLRVTDNRPGAIEELAAVIGYALSDLKEESPQATVSITQLEAFMWETFLLSEACREAYRFYKLEHSGQLIPAHAVEAIREAIRHATEGKPKTDPLKPSQIIMLTLCDDFEIQLLGNDGAEICMLDYQWCGSDGKPQLQFRTPGGDWLTMTDLDVDPEYQRIKARHERQEQGEAAPESGSDHEQQ